MENDTAEYTPKSARLAGEYLVGGLISFGILIFSLLVSGDCYFNTLALVASTAAALGSLCLLIAAISWGTRLSQRDGVPPGKTAAARYVLVAIYLPFVVYAVLSLLVFLTSRQPASVSVHVDAIRGGRGCKLHYRFYNEPTGTTLSVCHDKFLWAAKSGERIVAVEEVGPLGARILSFRRDADPAPDDGGGN